MDESTNINGALVFLKSKQFKLCRWRLRPLLPPSSETSSCQVTRLETSSSPSHHLTAKLLEKHKHAPLLGITVQNNLKYSHTVNRIISKLWPFIHCLKYANKLLPRHTLKGLYFMHAYPHLISNISIWGTEIGRAHV